MNAPRSGCPINLTLEALGDRWSLIVIRDLMFGNRRHPRVADPVGAFFPQWVAANATLAHSRRLPRIHGSRRRYLTPRAG